MGEAVSDVPERYALGEAFVPKGRYIDREFLQLEYDRLFTQVWQVACREEEIPDEGSFYDYEIGKASILVVRQADGSIKAFHNSCPHRGMKLIGGAGCVGEIRCRFHGFRFDIGGASTFVPCADEFLDRADGGWDLRPVSVGTWGGWVFVSMDPDPEPLLEWLDPLPASLEKFRLEDMRYRWRKRTTLPANWKTVIDAFIEGFHTPGTHPQTMRFSEGEVRPSAAPADPAEFVNTPCMPTIRHRNHSRFIYAMDPSKAAPGSELALQVVDPSVYGRALQYRYLEIGSLVTERDHRAATQLAAMERSDDLIPFFAFQELSERMAREEGVDFPDMSLEEYFEGNGDWHIFPTLVILVEKSCLLGYRVRPDGDDPDSCIFEMFSLEHFPADDVPETKWQVFEHWRHHDGWGQLPTQDLKNIGDIQGGLHSPGFDGHWLNTVQEMTVHNQHAIADRFIFGTEDDSNRGQQ